MSPLSKDKGDAVLFICAHTGLSQCYGTATLYIEGAKRWILPLGQTHSQPGVPLLGDTGGRGSWRTLASPCHTMQ